MKSVKYMFIVSLLICTTLSLFAKVESWQTFADEETEIEATRLSHVVIIRPKTVEGKAINIYIDGEYVSSLLPGAYTEEFVCPGKHRVNLAYTNPYTRYQEKRKGGEYIDFKPGTKRVYMVEKRGNKLYFTYSPQRDIPKLLEKYTKKQTHTISRLSKRKCTQPLHKKISEGRK